MAEKQVKVTGKLVVIGGSAGALDALLKILPQLRPAGFAIVIVVHRKGSNEGSLASLLASSTMMPVKEIEEKEFPAPGAIYLVPGDYHVLFERDKSFTLDYSEKVNYSRPSIDVVFGAAAAVFSTGMAAILLSGANADGKDGMREVKERGGITIAQSPESSGMPYMPSQAILNHVADQVLTPDEIAAFINGYG